MMLQMNLPFLIQSKLAKQDMSKCPRLTFPMKLHTMLTYADTLGLEDTISWDDSGTKFMIRNEEKFVTMVLSTAFKQSSISSFRRQLNAYGFEREYQLGNSLQTAKFPIYSHQHFLRDDFDACKKLSRRYTQKYSSKSQKLPDETLSADCNLSNLHSNHKSRSNLDMRSIIRKDQLDHFGLSSASTTCKKKSSKSEPGDKPMVEKIPQISDPVLDEIAESLFYDDIPCSMITHSHMIPWDPNIEELCSNANDCISRANVSTPTVNT